MMKKILYSSTIVFLLSIFNTLFKYKNVESALNNFNANSTVVSGYMISSSSEVSYIKIFLYTFLLSFIFFIILYFLLKKNIEVINVKEVLYFISGIIFSIILLYFNVVIGFIFLMFVFLFFVCFIYRKLNNRKLILFFVLFIILYLLLFYFVSF